MIFLLLQDSPRVRMRRRRLLALAIAQPMDVTSTLADLCGTVPHANLTKRESP